MAKSILRAGKITGVVIVAIIVVAVVLCSVGVLSVAQADYPPPETVALPESLPAEPADDLLAQCESSYTQAKDYWKSKKYDEAKTLYQYVAENSSDVERAYDGQLWVMYCEMELGSDAGALAAFEKLWKNHSSAKGFVEKATHACGSILNFESPETVLPYVDRALEVAEDVKAVMMLLQLKAQCYIDLGQSEQAQAVRQQIELYSDNEYYPGVQLTLAYVYRKNVQYEKAMEIYNEVLQSSTDDSKKLDAHAGIATIAISLGNDSDVTAAIESLCTNFAGHETLGWAVFVIGEEYYTRALKTKKDNGEQTKADFQKAIAIWDKNISQIADSEYQVMACYFSAIAYRYSKDYRKSAAYYLKVFTDFPGSEYAAHSLFMVGRYYEKSHRFARGSDTGIVLNNMADPNEVASAVVLAESTEITDPNNVTVSVKEKAVPVNTARSAYKLLLEKYPDSQGVAYARRWLNKRSSN